MNDDPMRPMNRRQLFQAGAAIGVGAALSTLPASVRASDTTPQEPVPGIRLADTANDTNPLLTIERRGDIVLFGLNRPAQQNKIDPDTYALLSKAYFQFEHDASLRAAVLFGHGDHFCQGIDVQAFAAVIGAGADQAAKPGTIEPWGKTRPRLSKPVVVAAHGNTWNVGHELFLACDIRIAAADTRFAQTENVHARMPASGATIRFVREAGWGQAMRYLLTGDGWTAQEAQRMGTVQELAPSAEAALQLAVVIATKVAACAPLSIKNTLASAHLAIDEGEEKAFAQLPLQRAALYATEDFKEALKAEREHRVPTYYGK
ncbi:crotonase/enoyl-CoA hydratase family protein [Undibacterium sp. TJN25]|uniref:crotonase/enoyl-CoA hydratase family protein n=1 Tax=Undibacterium sp. TJN25 TaxID=3413056 RepID=UPI003BF13F26